MASDRPSKKQQEILSFIDGFIKGNGYGPSYREVMRALGYKSVSTVAVHVDALIAKGYLSKGDGYSARSLEVVMPEKAESVKAQPADHLKWLRAQEKEFRDAEKLAEADTLSAAIKLLDPETEKPQD